MKKSTKIFVYAIALFFFVVGASLIAMPLVWRRAPQFHVDGATLDVPSFSYVPLPDGQQGKGLLLNNLTMRIQVSLSNLHTPSSVDFHDFQLAVAIANERVSLIQAPRSFHVRGWEALALGPFNVTASHISLGEPGFGAMVVSHVLPLQFFGSAFTSRKIAFFIPIHQTPRMACVINYNIYSRDILLPFKCDSHTPNEVQ